MKLGKLPARKGAISFKLSKYAAVNDLPIPPAHAGHSDSVSDWQGMLGNDRYGDCVFAGAAHETILWNKANARTVNFADRNVLRDYAAVTGFDPADPSSDKGTDVQLAASYRRTVGLSDVVGTKHKVAAYLAIKAGDADELKAAVYLFGSVGIGLAFPSSAMEQANAGEPWTVVASATIEGGHYVPVVGYDADFIYCVTWGKVQKMTWDFFAKYCDEAVAYVSDEYLTQDFTPEGFDLTTLLKDLAELN